MSGRADPIETLPNPRLGLVVLQADETIERDFRRIFPADDVDLFVTRIPSGAMLTPETIAAMEADLPSAVALLPSASPFATVAYACTSGTALIGARRVRELVEGATTTASVTNPLCAALAGFGALGLRRIGLVSPYGAAVSSGFRNALEARGITVVATFSFDEESEARVARIAPAAIAEAARRLASGGGLDGLFLSCTNLRTLDILDPLEAELGIPVLSSNQVLAWHMARSAGLDRPPVPGCLRDR
ncbi:maleate isomerase [Palleronia salina]|uniref:Maleate isomerase n=1 Tax=Palleronia salina TaxID=313368 RepID=A0A1M6LQW6_9RHOB|nr:aspartate/glutamate racemase family protein [Palleronia salina]SHJ73583.1 maleate isomerase [Palleronia salina]